MEKEEFNLSVLENVTSFSSPVNGCSEYEAIFSLIKEEIDINTEDETESHKAGKSPRYCKRKDSESCDSGPRKPRRKSYLAKSRKDSESYDSEGVFKSPYKRKSFPRLKSPVGLFIKRNSDDWKRNGMENFTIAKRTRSLGSLKSGRTFKAHYRKHFASVSRSSETSGLSDSVDSIISAVSNIENGEWAQSEMDDKLPLNVQNGKDKPEDGNVEECNQNSQTINEISDLKLSDEEFVESSQSTTISKFRQKLLNGVISTESCKAKATMEMIRTDVEINFEESDAKVPNCTLAVSPELKLSKSAKRELSVTPPRPRKRKASMTSPMKTLTPKQKKIDKLEETTVRTLRPRRSKTNVESPVKSFSQEFEDCIMPSDYQEMNDSIETDMLEQTSFTFETIELLNDYNPNPQENNHILSKILMTPTKEMKKDPLNSPENLAAIIEPTEDPLYIKDNETTSTPIASTERKSLRKTPTTEISSISKTSVESKTSLTQKSKEDENEMNEIDAPSLLKRKKSTARTSKAKKTPNSAKSKSTKRQSINGYCVEEAGRVGEPGPSTSARKKSVVKTPKAKKKAISKESENMKQRLTNESSMEGTMPVEDSILSTSVKKENIEEESTTKESTTIFAEVETFPKDDERRRSTRLTEKSSAQISHPDLEADEDLLMEAMKLSKKVQAAEKKLALSEETLEKLAGLVVELTHEVLPQHEIETRAGSAALSYEQQEEFLKYAPLNKDTYSPAEDDIIRENWKAFCEHHNWDPNDYKPFLHLKHGEHLIMSSLDERRKFVQFLANGLPYRPLHSVYTRFKILYTKYAAGGARYSHKEDMTILAHMLHNPAETPDKKCSELSKVLHRSRVSIWKRYKKLTSELEEKKKVLTKVDWTLPLAETFISKLLDVTVSQELIELKDAFIPKVVWLKMQKKMNIHYDVMKRFWEQQLHLQLFSPNPLYLNEIKIMLIELMYQKKVRHPSEIKWNTIVKYFDGLTVAFLRKTFNHLTAKASTKLGSHNLKSVLKWLYKKEIALLKDQDKDKCLPRITYENKKAQILPEDLERIKLCPENLK